MLDLLSNSHSTQRWLLAVALVLAAARAGAQCQTLDWTINNPVPTPGDNFGYSVSMSGTLILVGEPNNDTPMDGAGAAHLYDASTHALVRSFDNPSPAAFDRFGVAVAISGNYVLVGADADDTGATAAGSAYLFDAASGSLLHTFNNPTPATNDQFGWAVAISADYVLVGAFSDNTGANDAGSAYLFDPVSGSLLHTFNNPDPVSLDFFGDSVAISGNRILIGATNDDTGAADTGSAYLFDAVSGSLLHTFNNPDPAVGDQFGRSVGMSGNSVLVGAYSDSADAAGTGRAYLFDAASGSLLRTFANPSPENYDNFGLSVAISGNIVLIGAWNDDTGETDAGAAYLFDAATGSLLLSINNPDPAAFDNFGNSVVISGGTLLIAASSDSAGASYAGSAYLYSCPVTSTPTTTATPSPTPPPGPTLSPAPSATPTPTPAFACQTLERTFTSPAPADYNYFGSAVAISENFVLVGSPDSRVGVDGAGKAHLFDVVSGALLQTFNNPTPGYNDYFGNALAISGNYVLIGAGYDDTGGQDAGAAYLFDALSGTLLQTFNNPTPADFDQFGLSVAISGDNVLVGAWNDDTGRADAGSAYLFDGASGGLLRTFNNPTPAVGDAFGVSVAISANNVLVGAYYDDTDATVEGRAYLLDAVSGTLLQTFNNPSPGYGDRFGESVAISGNNVLIGAPFDDTGTVDAGSAYLFDAASGALLKALNNPAPATNDQFGGSVAVSGNNLIVGAGRNDPGASDAGSAYFFNAGSGALLRTFEKPVPRANDYFGYSVAVAGDRILVGAFADDIGGSNTGSAYLFACSASNAALDWILYD